MVIVLSVLWFTSSVYLFGISWSLYCLSSDLRVLFTSLVSPGHCIVSPLIYEFCLPLWYLLVIVLSVLWYTTSVYLFGISWSLYCLSSDIRFLFTSFVSLGHCIVCPLICDFCLPLWYLFVIVLSVLWFTSSVYLFVFSWSLYCLSSDLWLLFTSLVSLWSLYCLSSDLRVLFTSLVSLGHCIVYPLIYDFYLPLWYLLVIVLSVLLFTSLVSLGHCIFCPLIYDFSLTLWYLLVIVLSVLWYTTSVYLIGISWSLYCLSSDIWLLFTSLVSLGPCILCSLVYEFCLPLWYLLGHCIVCSLINEFCLSLGHCIVCPLVYLLVIVLSVLWSTTSVYLFGIAGHCIVYPLIYDFCLPLWSLSCLSSVLSVLLFTSLVSLGHCIVCPLIYDFCLPLWYLLVIVLSVLWYTTCVYLFGNSWSLYCLSSDLRVLFTSLVSPGHCIVCPLIYDFCLPLWYLLVIELSVLLVYDFCLSLWYLLVVVLSVLWFMASVYLSWSLYCLSSGLWLLFISWSLYCLSSGLRLLFTSLLSLGHCIFCPLIYDFCLPLWYLLVIILSVLWFTSSVYLFGISWSLYCLSVLWYTTSVYLFGISWSLYCLSSDIRFLFTSLVSLGHCIVCPLICDFCLPLWYLVVIVLSVLWFTSSVYLFVFSSSLYCLSSDLWLLFTSLISLGHCIACPLIYEFCLPLWYFLVIVLSIPWFMTSIYLFGISLSLYCLSSCLPLWYLLVIVLSVLWSTTSVYLFGISWSLYCLSSDIRLLFTSLVSPGHCIFCPLIYEFCLPLWYFLVIVLSIPWFMTSIYLFGISWSLYCLSSCLPLWYLLVIVLSVLWFTTSVYLFGISWSLYCLSSDIRLLFTSLISPDYCIFCPLIYEFCLPRWYLRVIVLSVLWFMTSVYFFGISWSLYCLSSGLRFLFTSLVSLGHCIVCPLIYDFCLPLWYLLVIVLSVLWYTTSVYLFGNSWSLYCLSFDLRVLFTSLVSLGHWIVCPLVYDFCLSLWYLLVVVLSVLWFMASVYLLVIVLSVLWFMTSVYL